MKSNEFGSKNVHPGLYVAWELEVISVSLVNELLVFP
jgi:hypothetical protein